jgi:hypothetical protein
MNNFTISLGYSYFRPGIFNSIENSFFKPGTYAAIEDPNIPGYYNFAEIPVLSGKSYTPKFSSPVVGIGGITKVGKKASFIFDGILSFGKISNFDQVVTYNYDLNSGSPLSTFVNKIESLKTTNLILMPGMRFQKSQSEAFQVTLAGVIGSIGDIRYSFPIPMCSWFYKF